MRLAKIHLKSGYVFGKVSDDGTRFITPSGASYEIDADGFVHYVDGKKYRLLDADYMGE